MLTTKMVVQFIIFLAFVAMGIYLGFWEMLIGGITQIVEAVKAAPVEKSEIALGALRCMFAGPVAWATIAVGAGVNTILDRVWR